MATYITITDRLKAAIPFLPILSFTLSRVDGSKYQIRLADINSNLRELDNILWAERIKENKYPFLQKVVDVCKLLSIKPNWLMQCMYKETAGTFSPSIVNFAGSKAVGLIQFMPTTAKALGTTTEKLSKMSNVEQLDWVYKYMKPYKGKMKDFGDTYLAIFYPAAIGKPDSYLLPASVTKQNKGMDFMPKDGRISKAEIKAWVSKGTDATKLV